jgi:hypothetical protein
LPRSSPADIRFIGFSLPIPALLRPLPIRTRLWQAAGVLVLVVVTFTVGNFLVPRDRALTRNLVGHDFLAFYTAGTFARLGQSGSLYDLGAVQAFQRETARVNSLSIANDVAPFWNPPFYAWLFAPLSALRYRAALNAWLGINLVALGGAIVLLIRMLPAERDWRSWALVPLLVCTSMPFIQTITHGQNVCISLLLLCAAVTAWRTQRDALAGALCGLMFYKPQLAAVLAVMLVLDRGARAMIGLGCALGALFLLTAVTMPGGIGEYAHAMPLNVRAIQVDQTYLWERHVTLKAMFRLLVQGRVPGESSILVTALTSVTCGAIGAGLLWVAWRARRASAADDVFTGETKFLRRDRLIAATIASTPLVMPFYFDYDLLLLSAAAVLFAGEMMMRAPGAPRRLAEDGVLFAWVALFGWMMINARIAGASGVNVVVVILTALAAALIRRAARAVEPSSLLIRRPQVIAVTARRAA